MLSNIRTTRIEWSDCDPAGIVFYPRYFEMFDISTTVMIERALGMRKLHYLTQFGFAGHPLVETRAKFRIPTRFGDQVEIATQVVECGRSSFKIEHRLTLDGALAVEGTETRVWVVRDPDDLKRIKAAPLPAEVAAKLKQGAA